MNLPNLDFVNAPAPFFIFSALNWRFRTVSLVNGGYKSRWIKYKRNFVSDSLEFFEGAL